MRQKAVIELYDLDIVSFDEIPVTFFTVFVVLFVLLYLGLIVGGFLRHF